MEKTTGIEPKPAATVILVRERAGELQVYLLRRSTQSGFMGGFYVFPGGVVDPEDRDLACRPKQVRPSDFSKIVRGGLNPAAAVAYAVAAVRETFEEAGVLLLDKQHAGREDYALAFELRRSGRLTPGWLNACTGGGVWAPAFSILLPWSHWITPRLMQRRFDTRFFIVNMPDGGVCSPDKTEVTHGLWVSPENGLEENMAGRIPLSPPTLVTLQGLLGFKTFSQIKLASQANGWGRPIMPRLVPLKNAALILEPWDPCYEDAEVAADAAVLGESVLEAGEPFSRLWNGAGSWKPVGCPGLDCRD